VSMLMAWSAMGILLLVSVSVFKQRGLRHVSRNSRLTPTG